MFFPYVHFRDVEKKYVTQLKKFGKRVKRLREKAELSQPDLAGKCDVDYRTIQRIENGEYGLGFHILLALAEAFKTSPSQLLRGIK
jgi:transcriptional regulator with XRE-family HTH domain